MTCNKKMTIIFAIVAVALVVFVIVAWWRIFFDTANPPLPQATITVQTSTTSATAAPGVVLSGAAPSVPTPAVTSPIVSGENPPLAEEHLNINGATFNIEVASTVIEQTRGLSYRPSLGAQSGMLFIFGSGSVQSFWMFGMNFPLDMIWISDNVVAGFTQNVPAPTSGTAPWSLPVYTSPNNVDKVLEVNAGMVAKYNIKVGDTVTIEPIK
jgi:uncharacterized membrane protein (UPF0127 family)